MKTRKENILIETLSTEFAENPKVLKPNYKKTKLRNRFHFTMGNSTIVMFCILGIILLSSCKKDIELLPAASSTFANDSSLKVGAMTYYISTTGSDAAAGDISHPWKTLYYASTRLTTPGSIIHIKAGTYLEHKMCNLAVGVSIEGEGAALTIIKSDYKSAISYSQDGTIRLYSSTITNGNQHISGIGFDGMLLAGMRGISVNRRNNVSIYKCDFKDFLHSPAAFFNVFYESYTEPATYCTGNSFHDNTVSNCTSYPGAAATSNFQGLWFSGQDGFEVYNCVMKQTTRICGIGGDLVASQSNRRWKIHDNTFTKGNPIGSYWNFALEIRWNFGECQLYNNSISGVCDLPYLLKQKLAYGAIVRNNIFSLPALVAGSRSYGLTLEGWNFGVTIKHNTFKNVASGVSIASGTSTAITYDSISIQNNVFSNIGRADKAEGWGVYLMGSSNGTYKNIYVSNNTIIGAGYGKSSYGICGFSNGTVTNLRFQNNIISDFGLRPIVFAYTSGTLKTDIVYLRNNLFYNNGSAGANNIIYYYQSTPTHQYVSNNLATNPLFVSTTDFHLKTSSPAINTGINVGLPFKASAPDRGAFEY